MTYKLADFVRYGILVASPTANQYFHDFFINLKMVLILKNEKVLIRAKILRVLFCPYLICIMS